MRGGLQQWTSMRLTWAPLHMHRFTMASWKRFWSYNSRKHADLLVRWEPLHCMGLRRGR